MKSKNTKIKPMVANIVELMQDKKAQDIVILNVKKLTSLTDYFINCSSQSDPQIRAIKNHIEEQLLEKYRIKPSHIEGYEGLRWILMDYINIVVNIFNEEEREYYNIERLWSDGKVKEVK